MDLFSVITSLSTVIADKAQHVIVGASDYIPEELSRVIKHAYIHFPKEIDLVDAAQFVLYFAVSSLVLGVIGRIVLGKRSSLNHSLSAVMGIAFIYVATIIVYTFQPWDLQLLLSPLPFVTFSGEYLIVLPIVDAQTNAVCSQIVSLIILSFLVNMIDSIMPEGQSIFRWYLLRFLTVILSMLLHLVVNWAVNTYLPEFLLTYAPAVLLAVFSVMLLSGFLSLIIGLVIAITNPFLGAMYTFFFSSVIGKQLTKAVFSSAVLCGIFYLLERFDYTVICISGAALISLIPFLLVLLALWYLVGHLL